MKEQQGTRNRGAFNPEDLFEGVDVPVDPQDISPEDIINIDDIDAEAKSRATKLVNKVKKIYFTNEELKNDSYATTIIDRAIDSITLLQKMLLSNSQIQDKLITNICLNSGNGTLYMSLTRIQDAIMDIQKQIKDELNDLHADLHEIKESNLDDEDEEEDNESKVEQSGAFRGGKDFLKSLKGDNEIN